MKQFLFICMFISSLFACNTGDEPPYVTTNNDTISKDFLITDRRVGKLRKGMSPGRLYKIYGENFVKQMQPKITNENSANPTGNEYYVYDRSNRLLFIARTSEKDSQQNIIEQITIKDKRFKTTHNVGLGSTIGAIREAYKEIHVITRNNQVFLFIPSIDGYFEINNRNIRGWHSEFIGDISLDSISNQVKPISLTIQWYSNDHGVFSSKFWKDITHKLLTWIIVELPSILILIGLFLGLLRLLIFVIKRVKKIAIHRATKDINIDTDEAMKRINTLAGIVHGIGKIFLWTVFLLILLAKININIGPILASAGIVGLAVGFGAQELVRDFISGFFILLEDQLRTGDMAIINGTTGLVEKIELRTITLRDASGVVHIFQNGKINTLSNMTKEWSAIVLEIGVAYKEDIDHVMQLMRKTGDEMYNTEEYGSRMLNSVEVLGLDNFGDSAIIIKAIIKTRPMQQWAIKREYQRRLKIVFDQEGVEIPFPHLSIYTGEVTKPMPIILDKSEVSNRE